MQKKSFLGRGGVTYSLIFLTNIQENKICFLQLTGETIASAIIM